MTDLIKPPAKRDRQRYRHRPHHDAMPTDRQAPPSRYERLFEGQESRDIEPRRTFPPKQAVLHHSTAAIRLSCHFPLTRPARQLDEHDTQAETTEPKRECVGPHAAAIVTPPVFQLVRVSLLHAGQSV